MCLKGDVRMLKNKSFKWLNKIAIFITVIIFIVFLIRKVRQSVFVNIKYIVIRNI